MNSGMTYLQLRSRRNKVYTQCCHSNQVPAFILKCSHEQVREVYIFFFMFFWKILYNLASVITRLEKSKDPKNLNEIML